MDVPRGNGKKQVMGKPIVYIASPYTQGDVAMNTHFQCKIFDRLLTDGKVLPVAPLWSHFQHMLFPRPYEDWIRYDQDMLRLYDCCLRLAAIIPENNYNISESSGAELEVESFVRMGKPVFYSIPELYEWVDSLHKEPQLRVASVPSRGGKVPK